MTIQAIAYGLVVGEPVALMSESDSATVLLLRDGCGCDLPVEYEVFCRDADLARLVLERVTVGDSVVVLGALMLHRVLTPVEDEASAARVVFDATTVARDLNDDHDVAGIGTDRPGRHPNRHTGRHTGRDLAAPPITGSGW